MSFELWSNVKRASDGTSMIVTSAYYENGNQTRLICKWYENGELHMATYSVDEVV